MFSRDFTVFEGHGHPLVYYINSLVCSCVRLSVEVPILGFRFWKSRSWNPDRDQGFFFSPFSDGLPRVSTRGFFFSPSVQVLKVEVLKARSGPKFFFFSPFCGGLPRVNTRVFFFRLSRSWKLRSWKPNRDQGFFFRPFLAGCPRLKQCKGASQWPKVAGTHYFLKSENIPALLYFRKGPEYTGLLRFSICSIGVPAWAHMWNYRRGYTQALLLYIMPFVSLFPWCTEYLKIKVGAEQKPNIDNTPFQGLAWWMVARVRIDVQRRPYDRTLGLENLCLILVGYQNEIFFLCVVVGVRKGVMESENNMPLHVGVH